eukprot:1654772-Pyramimonas_sp.AAC.1
MAAKKVIKTAMKKKKKTAAAPTADDALPKTPSGPPTLDKVFDGPNQAKRAKFETPPAKKLLSSDLSDSSANDANVKQLPPTISSSGCSKLLGAAAEDVPGRRCRRQPRQAREEVLGQNALG